MCQMFRSNMQKQRLTLDMTCLFGRFLSRKGFLCRREEQGRVGRDRKVSLLLLSPLPLPLLLSLVQEARKEQNLTSPVGPRSPPVALTLSDSSLVSHFSHFPLNYTQLNLGCHLSSAFHLFLLSLAPSPSRQIPFATCLPSKLSS